MFLLLSGKLTREALESHILNKTQVQIRGASVHKLNFCTLSSYKTQLEREERLKTQKLTVTWEPLSHLISANVQKIVNLNYRRSINRAISQGGRTRVTFAGFARYISQSANIHGSQKLNEHWRPQTSLCKPCAVDYNFYSTVSTVTQDSAFILIKTCRCT